MISLLLILVCCAILRVKIRYWILFDNKNGELSCVFPFMQCNNLGIKKIQFDPIYCLFVGIFFLYIYRDQILTFKSLLSLLTLNDFIKKSSSTKHISSHFYILYITTFSNFSMSFFNIGVCLVFQHKWNANSCLPLDVYKIKRLPY